MLRRRNCENKRFHFLHVHRVWFTRVYFLQSKVGSDCIVPRYLTSTGVIRIEGWDSAGIGAACSAWEKPVLRVTIDELLWRYSNANVTRRCAV